ncbi:Transmembrane protease serine 6 [Acropora cervicornis]|uniref:Transmembrane protease serine 6 n=1 Tax=Acropora cervicornis TaxID=6130 RepID=A0AAD9VAJ3_ACRCE|nr:Transmembrane protease serine 6 [Acropora cervicornis]
MTVQCSIFQIFIGFLVMSTTQISGVEMTLPKVHPTKCVNPGIPKSGFRVGEVFSYGATVEYFCNPGFRISAGNRLRRCQKNEKWTGSLPICEGKTKISAYTCGTLGDTNSENSTRIRRIVGGKVSSHGSWPWVVAISYNNKRRGSYLFNGALIKPGWVLTVANVLPGASKLQVVLGEFNIEQMDGTETSMRVKRVVKHPLYDGTRSGFAHNIALLELETPVKLNDHIRMVCVPKRKRDKILESPLQYGTVAGWGSTKPISIGERTGPLSAKLRQVTVPIIPDKECKQATIYSYRKEDTLCAGFKRKPKDPCFGDIGSPLVMQNPRSGRWTVIGLFGWSEGCGQPRKYAYYTRVSKYRKWINSVVKGRQ